MKKKIAYLLCIAATALASCDDATGSFGIPADEDQVSNVDTLFDAFTRTVRMDSGIVANNGNCYIGRIEDPETGSVIEADFAAQYQCFENYSLPDKELMVDATDTTDVKHGVVRCDSVDIRLYFKSYQGSANNSMKLQVYKLSSDPKKMLSEDSIYNTDVDLTRFLDNQAKPLASRFFSATDYDVPEDQRNESDYQANIHVNLPREVGQQILEKYYENPKNFKDSYTFIRNVFPGLYFRCSSGQGTFIKVYAGTLNLYFKYSDEKGDSVFSGITRFAATPEVIQSTRFSSTGNIDSYLKENRWTYLKTPAGLATEMQLPIDKVFEGRHAADSVSLASITLTRYNKKQAEFQFDVPEELLMVRKAEAYRFFKNRSLPDARTSFLTTYNSSRNAYTYSNISRLLTYCKHEKIEAVRQRLASKGLSNFTQAQFDAEEALWMAENPDWDKVLFIPVITTSTTTTTGGTTITSTSHNLSISSVKLVGGQTPVKMQVVYSSYNPH